MKDTFYSLNDYELLYMIRTGDVMALELMLKKYENYVRVGYACLKSHKDRLLLQQMH